MTDVLQGLQQLPRQPRDEQRGQQLVLALHGPSRLAQRQALTELVDEQVVDVPGAARGEAFEQPHDVGVHTDPLQCRGLHGEGLPAGLAELFDGDAASSARD
eukprot:CAMPEP_0183472378 /NCGR_PEP_ID=MMETSP0370-20130417/159472_1 /TAXON_ID=268820 /ORGANISM="Peridinium aciculiferum, Strain PAER-2" /LENGTH=101 /DNA_ID=CAMNT_0025665011 /DNA_START=115 /DNA_END=417 /DNA_ORIENTATION=-